MNQQRKTYVVFDPSKGEIIGAYAVYDAGTRSYRTPTLEEASSAFRDLLAERKVDRIDILEADLPIGTSHAGYSVDVERRQLAKKPRLQVQADRTQIQGDGRDSVEIEISVIDEENNVVESFNNDLRVSTSRGRLSAPGGRIKVENGRASITLTSTMETVEHVHVLVRDPLERCTAGSISVEFL
jgi:hypothetical protein